MSTTENSRNESGQAETAGRRRFVRGVGVAVPVLLTISARSALACTCTSVSANASIALTKSHNAATDVNQPCSGRSPATWAALAPDQFTGANDSFLQVFGSGPNIRMRAVMRSTDSSVTEFMKYIAAAYVNSKKGRVATKFYDVNDLIAMWKTGPSGNYQPVPGANWDESKIMAYLKDTWT